MEENQNKPPSLTSIKLEISLEELFSLSFYRHNDNKIVVSEERFKTLSSQPGFAELIHVFKYESQDVMLYRLQRIEDYQRSLVFKDEQQQEKEAEIGLARQKHQIIEDWKKEARLRLLKTGKVTKEQIESLIIRCMNPESDRDKAFASKLNYPYREENKNE